MAEFQSLLKRLEAGEPLKNLLPEFKKAARAKKAPEPDLNRSAEAAADQDFESGDSFANVTAAWIAGDISDSDYKKIKAATQS